MKKTVLALVFLALGFGMWACEQPKSPDFKVNHEVQTPLTTEKTYSFLGQEDALIDSTSEDFKDLFSSDQDGLVHLSKQQDFNFGDLNDAIPEVDAPPTTETKEVGAITLNTLNASGDVGSAGFTDVTGKSNTLSKGDLLFGGSGTANIGLTTDYFVSAVVKENCSLDFTITNNLGFDIDQLTVTLKSDNEAVGSATISPLAHNATETTTISVPSGVSATNPLEKMNVDINATWSKQTMKEDGGELVVKDVTPQNLVVSQITGSIQSQNVTTSGTSNIDESNFEFRETDDFVELGSGDLSIDIDNNINISIETLDITFHDIVDGSGNKLVLNLTNIPARDAGGTFSDTIDLSGYRIKAQNGTLDYEISATTEDLQQGTGSPTRTVNETDDLSATVDLKNLQISRAEGYVVPKSVLLNTDQNNDGKLDIFNNDEAELTNIDGISDISNRISELTFENPILNTTYLTNLGVNTTVYAAIAGTDSDGNTVYLKGQDNDNDGNNPYNVSKSEVPPELVANGQSLSEDQLIKFSVDTAEVPDPQQGEKGENVFNASNTNSSAFFSNLPTQIRFVGIGVVNEAQNQGTLVNPVIFDPTLNLDLPIHFSANNATFKDTLDADLGDLPGEGDDQEISEATLTLSYTNGLPLDLNVDVIMVSSGSTEIFRKSDIKVGAASVNSEGYAIQSNQSSDKISFSKSELNDLNKVRSIILDIQINTPQQQAIRIRNDDSIKVQVKLKAAVTSSVN